MAFQVFISYARNDDLAPPGASDGRAGFVTELDGYLRLVFRSLGPPQPTLWRDKRAIEPSDQFDPLIEREVAASAALLVILSNNWIHRPYCVRELEMFAARWRHEGDAGIKRRIVVVGKKHLDPAKRPPLLQGQEGYKFYRLEDADELDPVGREEEFFGRGKLPDEYHDAVEALAKDLWRRAQAFDAAAPATAAANGGHHGLPASPPKTDAPAAPAPGGRTVFVAQPAPDMRAAHARVVDELRKRGYRVAPEPEEKIPPDDRAAAQRFVDDHLTEAEASIHLLGVKPGYRPEDDGGDPIVRLQLRRAAERPAPFRRMIWAPKILLAESAEAPAPPERDPLAVLEQFDRQRDADKIYGGELGGFVEFLIQHLTNTKPATDGVRPVIDADSRVFVHHSEEDTEYALAIAEALAERQIEPVMPVFGGSKVEVEAWRRDRLQECDAVIVCWAHSSEVWARSQTPEFRDHAKLGRDREFACRALIAGPPPDVRKGVMLRLPPRREVDVVLDLTARDNVAPDDLGPIVGGG
jgi:hypothetical protein